MIELVNPYSLLNSSNLSGPSKLLYCALSKTKVLTHLAEQMCYPEGLRYPRIFKFDLQSFQNLIFSF